MLSVTVDRDLRLVRASAGARAAGLRVGARIGSMGVSSVQDTIEFARRVKRVLASGIGESYLASTGGVLLLPDGHYVTAYLVPQRFEVAGDACHLDRQVVQPRESVQGEGDPL